MTTQHKKPDYKGGIGMKLVITMSRRYGTGASRIAQELSERLGIPVYDKVNVEEEMSSVCYSDRYVAYTVPNASGLYDYTLFVYKNDGTLAFSREIDFQYRYMDIDGDNLILYNENSCRVYNMSGVEKFDGTFDFTVSHIRSGRFPGTLIVTGPETMKEIRMR